MVAALVGWGAPALVTLAVVGVAYGSGNAGGVAKGVAMGCGLATLVTYVTTAALRLSWNTRFFWAVWSMGFIGRFVFVGTAAYVVLRHTQLDFVATMASLVGFTGIFLVLESATCLKKG